MVPFFFDLQSETSDVNAATANHGKTVTDASNIPSTLSSKVVSSSARPTTNSNDKENLPTIDKVHRPITAAVAQGATEHGMINGIPSNPTSTAPALINSSSIDASTTATSNAPHITLKSSASGGAPVATMMPSQSVTPRTTNPTDKPRSQTVRLPGGAGVRRRETIDPVQGGAGMRKTEDKTKVTIGET